jgi:hypothetical protein
MHNASAERVSNAFFIIQSLRTNMSACGAELLLLERVRPMKVAISNQSPEQVF